MARSSKKGPYVQPSLLKKYKSSKKVVKEKLLKPGLAEV